VSKPVALLTQPPRVAVVTGGASGIGESVCRHLAAAGRKIAVLDLDGLGATRLAQELEAGGCEALGIEVDVTDRPGIDEAFAKIRSQLGPTEILVTSAGMAAFDAFAEITPDRWQQVIEVNLTGTFHCCQAVIPEMLEAGWGRIVNISSSSAQGGQQLMAHYVSTKAAVIGLTKALALEFGRKGITVNTIPPGFIDTPMLRASEEKGLLGQGGVDAAIANTPVRRIGRPEDIAAACSFLVSDDASYVTGQIIGVNGGRNTG